MKLLPVVIRNSQSVQIMLEWNCGIHQKFMSHMKLVSQKTKIKNFLVSKNRNNLDVDMFTV